MLTVEVLGTVEVVEILEFEEMVVYSGQSSFLLCKQGKTIQRGEKACTKLVQVRERDLGLELEPLDSKARVPSVLQAKPSHSPSSPSSLGLDNGHCFP